MIDKGKAGEVGRLPIERGDRTNVWVREGGDLIRVGQIRGRGGAAQLGTVTVYDRTDGRLTGVLTAPRGARDGDGWRIGPVKSFDVASGRLTTLDSVVIGHGVRPDQFPLSNISSEESRVGKEWVSTCSSRWSPYK